MKRDKKIISVLLTTLAFSIGAIAFAFNVPAIERNSRTIATASSSRSVVSMTATTMTLSNGYVAPIETNGFQESASGIGALATEGASGDLYIKNTIAMPGISKITVNLVGDYGYVKICAGWKMYKTVDDMEYSEALAEGNSTVQYIFEEGQRPDYFKIYATANWTDIASITIENVCTESESSVSSLRLRVADIAIGAGEDLDSNNYVWFASNVEGETRTYLANYDSEIGYYYDLENVDVGPIDTTYGDWFSVYLCRSNSEFTWNDDYKSPDSLTGLVVTPGRRDITIWEATFDSQPAAQSYTLTVTYVEGNDTTKWPSSNGRNLVTSTTSASLASMTWNGNFSWVEGNTYTYTFTTDQPVIYIGVQVYLENANRRGGEDTTNGWRINFTSNTASLTLSFSYTSVANYYAGSLSNASGCTTGTGTMSFSDQVTTVYGSPITIAPTFSGATESFTASYSGNNIRIDNNNKIVGLKAGTTTSVTLTSQTGLTCDFDVTVSPSTYTPTATRDLLTKNYETFSETEEWFVDHFVDQVSTTTDFMNGIDISSCKALYDNGTKFYNSDGVEQSLFYILKDAGVNWVRLKLWVDPYTTGGISYGGGGGDLESTLWMAKEATSAGLKLLLDFHYSDFWTHPSQQILPKAWADASTVSQLQNYIRTYTTNTLNTFKNNGCLPDMVQLGNEISSGSFLNYPGTNSEEFNVNFVPGYLYNITGYREDKATYSLEKISNSLSGYNTYNMNQYLTAGIEGVNAVDSNIKTVVHWAKGSSISASVINDFFNGITADYDYAALSFYPFYCFDSMSDAQTILNGLSISKPWFVAETSYPFSGKSYVYEDGKDVTNFTISNWNVGDTNIHNQYAFNGQGQANLIHALTSAVYNAGGKGIFYWEGAWVPNENVGWAGQGSLCSWSNQGFFSYDGKAISNLNLFKQMFPNI